MVSAGSDNELPCVRENHNIYVKVAKLFPLIVSRDMNSIQSIDIDKLLKIVSCLRNI